MLYFPPLPSPPPTHFNFPVKMGVAVFALTDTLETAADLASRSGGKQELWKVKQTYDNICCARFLCVY